MKHAVFLLTHLSKYQCPFVTETTDSFMCFPNPIRYNLVHAMGWMTKQYEFYSHKGQDTLQIQMDSRKPLCLLKKGKR